MAFEIGQAQESATGIVALCVIILAFLSLLLVLVSRKARADRKNRLMHEAKLASGITVVGCTPHIDAEEDSLCWRELRYSDGDTLHIYGREVPPWFPKVSLR